MMYCPYFCNPLTPFGGVAQKDITLLNRIQSFFGVGTITLSRTSDSARYSVGSLKDLTKVIIPNFGSISRTKKISFSES